MNRDITWEGFHNARDLGGLPTVSGEITRYGRLIRSADTRFITAAGLVRDLDVPAYLAAAGVSRTDIGTLRRRLL